MTHRVFHEDWLNVHEHTSVRLKRVYEFETKLYDMCEGLAFPRDGATRTSENVHHIFFARPRGKTSFRGDPNPSQLPIGRHGIYSSAQSAHIITTCHDQRSS